MGPFCCSEKFPIYSPDPPGKMEFQASVTETNFLSCRLNSWVVLGGSVQVHKDRLICHGQTEIMNEMFLVTHSSRESEVVSFFVE